METKTIRVRRRFWYDKPPREAEVGMILNLPAIQADALVGMNKAEYAPEPEKVIKEEIIIDSLQTRTAEEGKPAPAGDLGDQKRRMKK